MQYCHISRKHPSNEFHPQLAYQKEKKEKKEAHSMNRSSKPTCQRWEAIGPTRPLGQRVTKVGSGGRRWDSRRRSGGQGTPCPGGSRSTASRTRTTSCWCTTHTCTWGRRSCTGCSLLAPWSSCTESLRSVEEERERTDTRHLRRSARSFAAGSILTLLMRNSAGCFDQRNASNRYGAENCNQCEKKYISEGLCTETHTHTGGTIWIPN